jgi:nucleoside-diphosphate-sugar epimerase
MAAFFIRVLLSPTRPRHDVYNTSVLQEYSGAELVDAVRLAAPEAELTPVAMPSYTAAPPVMDSARARGEFAFEPRFSLADAFAEMIAHYRTGRDVDPAGG